ncbi:transcriptional regulatory protein qseB [Paraglaciecola mesophila KMM 241]|uniref:Transcriptional regulatory protein qseB n=1 Tax=Paraglaciecola mesophila KMM 241 TaxID=1128912 RepID=K6Y187_9ALTE|nr:response regulator [Paraglaciecola mesophila]GAC26604.1 transcriptional regulatory protein qseB [Paraglaciecola mesophila KMM 241]
MHILLVEDDDVIADAIVTYLITEGMAMDHVSTISAAETFVQASHFDMCILDLNLPDGDGINWLLWLRRQKYFLPVLILTARNGIDDKVAGLKKGADDYLLKPFDLRELLARLISLQRRATNRLTNFIHHGQLQYDIENRRAELNGIQVSLSRCEDLLLVTLLNNPSRIITESQLKDVLYGVSDDVASNALNVHIYNLRKKLGTKAVETVRGFGFRLGKIETVPS